MTNEKEFGEKYSHRCFMKCYGLIKEKGVCIGFLYQYLNNGSLDEYVKSNEKIDNIFILMTLSRIFEGIEFLHCNSLIFRDLKPANVLFDNNYVPYISDLETIRTSIRKEDYRAGESLTNNIGSLLYSSPEQYSGQYYSYPTDIYSFGLIIYFLFEKKHSKSDGEVSTMTIGPLNFKNLYNKCINVDQNNRPGVGYIKQVLCEEINNFQYMENFLINENVFENDSLLIDYIYESLSMQYNTSERFINKIYDDIKLVFDLIIMIKQNDESCFF